MLKRAAAAPVRSQLNGRLQRPAADREADLAGEDGDRLLMRRMAVGVHENDGDRAEAVVVSTLEIAAHNVEPSG